jgi:DNA adenine methylase
MNKLLRSPLFYVGDKYKILKLILPKFPPKINRFIEPFTGGGSVFMNVSAKEYLLNDIDVNLIKIHEFLNACSSDKESFFSKVEAIISQYNLSYSCKYNKISDDLKKKYKKTYYAHFNKEGYNKLRNDYNKSMNKNPLILYVLLIFGFNRMIRFNSKGEFNLPVGNVDFNKNVQMALEGYFSFVNKKNIKFFNMDYQEFIKKVKPTKNDFIYLDPPYLLSFSEYNKYWNENEEKKLIKLLEFLNKCKTKFAVSNVIKYKNKENVEFSNWAVNYNILNIKSNYISYHDNTIKEFSEILVTNYETETEGV